MRRLHGGDRHGVTYTPSAVAINTGAGSGLVCAMLGWLRNITRVQFQGMIDKLE